MKSSRIVDYTSLGLILQEEKLLDFKVNFMILHTFFLHFSFINCIILYIFQSYCINFEFSFLFLRDLKAENTCLVS